jgi:hypothetical protein
MTMTSLIISDLSVTEQLDARAMSAVRGGTYSGCYLPAPSYCLPSPTGSVSKSDFSFDATQMLGQAQNTQVNNGNNVAFASGITSNVTPTQTGSNNIHFGGLTA